MSILESIKGERKLSFNHWRYRLLHWCFNVENPQINQDTGLPRFLYTHYCPLFHLTNLIAILSPLVLLVKIMVVFAKAIAWAFSSIDFGAVKRNVSSFFSAFKSNSETTSEVVVDDATIKKREQKIMIKKLCVWQSNFEDFWNIHKHDISFEANDNKYRYDKDGTIHPEPLISKEEAEAIFNEYMPQILDARNKKAERRKRLQERLIFWTNFSRVFIKWAMYGIYGVLIAGIAYLTWITASPVWEGLCWIANGIYWLFTNEGSLESFLLFLKFVFWGALGFGLLYGLFRIGFIQAFVGVAGPGIAKLGYPFYIFARFGKWVAGGMAATWEFVSMFYEENCPPIKLVTEEQAELEKIAQDEDD